MEHITITHIISLSASLLIAIFSGWLLTETEYRIADKHWLLNRKPFSCRPCLTFHFGWMLCGAVALYTHKLSLLILGIVASFIIWLILEIRNKKKIDK